MNKKNTAFYLSLFLLSSVTGLCFAQDVLFDRSDWTVTTSIEGARDNVVKGTDPEYIIDNDTTTSFLFVKPGKEHEGIKAPSDYIPFFIIDMKKEQEIDLFVYKHRANGNTNARIRAYAISIYGNNANDDNFQPIKEDIVLNTSLDAAKITIPQAVSYRYVKVVITNWYKPDGFTIQVAEFYTGQADDSEEEPVIVENDDVIFTPEGVRTETERVITWQQNNFSYNTSGNESGITVWTNATLYIGLAQWADVSDNTAAHYAWLYTKGEEMNWRMGEHLKNSYSYYHADEFCVGQMFLKLYNRYEETKMITPTITRLNWVMNNPPNPSMASSNKQSWTWCDALFMAPPVYAQVAAVTQEEKYLQFMDAEFKKTYDHLFDSDEDLFFRDASYFNQREANGEKVFWGRGNGWSFAGTVNVLRELPADSPYRSFYETLYRKMALRLLELQNDNGAWHASLLDPVSYPSPETSASGLITYAMVYGLNNGLLTNEEALRPVLKAWSRLCSAIQSNGKLGWVQPVGQDPKTITANMTATFGVGAFLLAASEIYKLVEKPIDLVPEISLSAKKMSLNEGRCKELQVYFFPYVADKNISWKSSDPTIASVSADGEICGLAKGKVVITAALSGNPTVTAVCEVEVKQTSVTGTNETLTPDYFKHPNTNITVYDLQGRIVLSTTLGNRDYKMLLKNNVPTSGFYIVRFQLEGQTKTVKEAIDK